MYVCLCRGLTEEDIRNEVKNGCKTPKEVMEKTLAGLGCSCCVEQLESIVIDTNQCTTAPKDLLIAVIKPF